MLEGPNNQVKLYFDDKFINMMIICGLDQGKCSSNLLKQRVYDAKWKRKEESHRDGAPDIKSSQDTIYEKSNVLLINHNEEKRTKWAEKNVIQKEKIMDLVDECDEHISLSLSLSIIPVIPVIFVYCISCFFTIFISHTTYFNKQTYQQYSYKYKLALPSIQRWMVKVCSHLAHMLTLTLTLIPTLTLILLHFYNPSSSFSSFHPILHR
jgi:hypothetical protein